MVPETENDPSPSDLTIVVRFLIHIVLAAVFWLLALVASMIGPGESLREQEILEGASSQFSEMDTDAFLIMTRTSGKPEYANLKGYILPSDYDGLGLCGQDGFEPSKKLPLSKHSLELVEGCRKWVRKDFFNEVSVIVTKDKAFITEYYR